MASRRLTMTCSAAIRRAPVARLTLTMAGSSCGVSPTASASENSTESMSGRCSSRLITKIAVTSTTIARTTRMIALARVIAASPNPGQP